MATDRDWRAEVDAELARLGLHVDPQSNELRRADGQPASDFLVTPIHGGERIWLQDRHGLTYWDGVPNSTRLCGLVTFLLAMTPHEPEAGRR